MSHVRTQIRQAAAAALAGLPATVSTSRAYPLDEAELPALLVSTNAEDIEGGTMGAFRRTLELIVTAVARGSYVDDDLDALAVSVETALNRNTLGGLVVPLGPIRVETTFETGSAVIGRLAMTFRAIYFTEFDNPQEAL